MFVSGAAMDSASDQCGRAQGCWLAAVLGELLHAVQEGGECWHQLHMFLHGGAAQSLGSRALILLDNAESILPHHHQVCVCVARPVVVIQQLM